MKHCTLINEYNASFIISMGEGNSMKKANLLLFCLCLFFPNLLYSQKLVDASVTTPLFIQYMKKKDIESLKELCMSLLNKSDYKQTMAYSRKLLDTARTLEKTKYEMYADICLGQAMLMTGSEDSAKYYLDHSLFLATKLRNDSALCSVYNGLGLYAANVKMDYYGAIAYFYEGIKAAKRAEYERLHTVLTLNMAGIYYLKKDPVGLKYSLECYETGHRKADPFLIYTASANVAYMYYLVGDYVRALQFIKEAEQLMLKNDYYDQSKIYTLHGHILFALGKDNEATANFKKALLHLDKAQPSSVSDTYLGYADVLIKKKKYGEAIAHLKKSLEWSKSQKNVIYRQQAIKRLSEVYELMGNNAYSLNLYKEYHLVSDSIFNIDKERSLNEQRIRFDLENNEEKMHKQDLIIKAKQRQLQLFSVLVAISLACILIIYAAYRRKNELYTRIVKQNKKAIEREAEFEQQIEQLKKHPGQEMANEKYSVSSLSDEKSTQLFVELEKLMNEQHLYRKRELTKENVAEILQTNRTYLSQVINQQTGMSFTYYVNSYRIKEAVKILSDPGNTVLLKALAFDLGFSSINTFYSSFQTIVGMPPSTYRKKISELDKTF